MISYMICFGLIYLFQGSVYAVYGVIAVYLAALFALQYALCKKCTRIAVKLIPVYFAATDVLSAVAFLIAAPHMADFMGFNGFFGAMFLAASAVCSLAVGLAWAVNAIKSRRKTGA